MSFDLRIHFSGLMMWVPEGQAAMHVLLPSTEGHDHGAHLDDRGGVHLHEYTGAVPARAPAAPVDFTSAGNGAGEARRSAATAEPAPATDDAPAAAPASAAVMPPHHARVVYDAAYEQPGQTQLSRTYVLVDLSSGVLEFIGLPTDNGINVRLTDEIPSLAAAAEPVPRVLVTQPPDKRLAGRVSMDAGALTHYELGAAFIPPGQETPQRMTPGTEWTIRGIRSRKESALGGMEFLPGRVIQGAAGNEVGRLPDLYPIGETIHLTVFYTVSEQLPPKGPFAQEATEDDPHFGAYFGISPARIGGGLSARKSTGLKVAVRGPTPSGPEIPGAICVQSQNVLGV